MHPRFRLPHLLALVLLMLLGGGLWTQAAAADLDGPVNAAVPEESGKIWIGGSFQNVSRAVRQNLARVTSGLELEDQPALSVDGAVSCIAHLKDGSTLIGGAFSSVGGATRNRLAKIDASGVAGSDFQPNVNGTVSSILLLADDRLLICGAFTAVDGVSRTRIARLHADGSLDETFVPDVNGPIYGMHQLASGKILIGGQFSQAGGQPHGNLARLEENGITDPSYSTSVNNRVNCMTVQADGRILIGGAFSASTGFGNKLARLTADGLPGTPLLSTANGEIHSIAIQADGMILLGGSFTVIGSQTRNRFARLLASGSLDTFFLSLNGPVHSLAVSPVGAILMGGEFTYADNAACGNLISSLNTVSATSTLSFQDASTVRWMRGGASAEATRVSFDFLPEGQSGWSDLGSGVRIAGGWELGGIPPLGPGIVRARAVTRGGRHGGSSGLVQALLQSGNSLPSTRVTDSQDTPLENGEGTLDFGSCLVGAPRVVSIDYENQGPGAMTGMGGNFTGTDASDFSFVTRPPRELLPGQKARITVQFKPSSAGLKSGLLRLVSSDPSANPFTVQLTGAGTSSLSPHFPDPGSVPITSSTFSPSGLSFGTLTLGFAPTPGTVLTVIDRPGIYGLTSYFADLTPGDYVTTEFAGTVYTFLAHYRGGGGGDLVLMLRGAGVLDMDFTAKVAGQVRCIATQPDGSILVAGSTYSTVENDYQASLMKLRSDGTLDQSFLGAVKGDVEVISIQADGKILIGGRFSLVNKVPRANLARLHPDGSVDTSFGADTDGIVRSIRVDPEGRLLIGGDFTKVNSAARGRVARLQPEGSLDVSFHPEVSYEVNSLLIRDDGSIVLGGRFNTVNGLPSRSLVLLSPEGAPDPSFQPALDGDVLCLALQPDGRFVAGGDFTQSNGLSRSRLARFNNDGSLDGSFNPGADATVHTAMVQADGKILIGGKFISCGGVRHPYLAALLPDGAVDATFRAEPSDDVYAVAADSEGRTLAGGDFNFVHDLGRGRLARFDAAIGSASTLSRPSAERLTWTRGGSMPEISSPRFEHLESGSASWTLVGDGFRMPVGWEITRPDLPTTGIFRVRAQAAGGIGGGSACLTGAHLTVTEGTPSLSVLRKIGDPLSSGVSIHDLGKVMDGFQSSSPLVLANTGSGHLSNIVATLSGTDAADFKVVTPPLAGLAPGDVTSLAIRFQPGGPGIRTAQIEVTASPPGTTSFTVLLRGEGTGQTFSPVFKTPADVILTTRYFTPFGRTLAPPILEFPPQPGTTLMLVDERETYYPGEPFTNAPNGSYVTAYHGTTPYQFIIAYYGGSDNDIILTLRGPGTVDLSFAPSLGATVHAFGLQPDGKIVVGGRTSTSSGQIMRVNPDGTNDSGFSMAHHNNPVYAVAIQPDTKILVGGSFTSIANGDRNRIARLLPNGALDSSFNPNANGAVNQIAVLAGGKILISGEFTLIAGISRKGIARLHADGTLDPSFTPQLDGTVSCTLPLADGRILAGGIFDAASSSPSKKIIRLNADGSRDLAFSSQISGPVYCLARELSGKILAGGSITGSGTTLFRGVLRLHPDGSFDSTFGEEDSLTVQSIASQSNGKVLAARTGWPDRSLQKMLPDGGLDPSFHTHIATYPLGAGTLPDGRILMGGLIHRVNGVGRGGLAVLENESAGASVEVPDLSTLRLIPTGAAPDAQRVAFELKNGNSWIALGEGERTQTGWQLNETSLPASGTVRARSFIPGGMKGGSAGISDQILTYSITPTALETWRLAHFGAAGNSGAGGDDQDPDKDRLPNLIEYAFGLHPNQPSAAVMPKWTPSGGGFQIEFQQPASVSGITYRAEWSTTLGEDDWTEIPDSGSGKLRRFTVARPELPSVFVRLKVSRP